ncbi:phosphoglycerate mutase family protein [Patescibacteria group bacterium]|nr:phosphoglycerate mutase family protein [Patescibacteria group bacterium]
MRNRYVLVRHGESKANVEGIIISDPVVGLQEAYGLSSHGKRQVLEASHAAATAGLVDAEALIHTSPFSRTKETAEIAREAVGAAPVIEDERLRERWFGVWERTSNANYSRVWRDDESDIRHTNGLVESVAAVAERILALVEELDEKHHGKTLVLVSHGDPLDILRATLRNDAADHCAFQMKTAEFRVLDNA